MKDVTPGKWNVNLEQGLRILADDPRQTIVCSDLGPSGNAGAMADARLIAASPELYEALRWFIDDIDGTHTVMLDFDKNVERARAALKKAEGK